MKYIPYIIIVLLLVASIGWILYSSLQETPGDGNDVPIEKRFDEKIIYTTNLSVDITPLKEHCEANYGVFNECGSICASDADVCADVCAYTCDL